MDVRTVDDVSYISKIYPHPENSQKQVVVTELYMVGLDEEERNAGCTAHYMIRGEVDGEEVNIPSIDKICESIESKLPLVDGQIPCREYTEEYSKYIKTQMLAKGILK